MPGPLSLVLHLQEKGAAQVDAHPRALCAPLPSQPLLPGWEWGNWEQEGGQKAAEIPAEADVFVCVHVCDGSARVRNQCAAGEAAPWGWECKARRG